MDRYNRDIVDIALSLEDGETIDLHAFMHRSFPYRKVSERYKHGNYHTNAEAIVLSTWSNRKAYIMCGAPGYGGVPSSCHQTLVCEACCKKAAARMYVRYQASFNKAQHWYAITYSFTSNIFLDSATQEEFLARYKVADSFIRSLRSSGLIQGAVAVREISVNSFHGKAVFPHTHIVANSDRSDLINEDGSYHSAIVEEASKAGVSIKVTRITDERSFLTQLKYPLKPINIKSLYEQEAINYNYNDINLGLDCVLQRLTAYGKHTPRIVYYGNMDARCKNYFGTNMNQQKKAQRALARSQAADTAEPVETKELNSSPSSLKIVSMQLNPATTTMAIATQPVLPPQTQPPQKRKNFWGPLALGAGAGLAGLGAYDQLGNQGRVTSALVNQIKSLFGSSPAAPRKPVTLGPARTQGDAIADASAGYLGSKLIDTKEFPGHKDFWRGWLAVQKDDAANNAFSSVPGQPGYTQPVSNLTQGADALVQAGGSGGGLLSAGMFGGTLASAGGAKLLGSASPRLAGGLSRIAGGLSKSPVARALMRVAGPLMGASQAHQLGSNPLTVEAFMDRLPYLSPEQAANAAKGSFTGIGAAGAARLPFLGPLTLYGDNVVADRAVDQIRGMAGSTAERATLADIMTRLHRGTRANNPHHRAILEQVLKYVDANKPLTDAIAGKAQNPWYKRWPVWGDTDDGSPALQGLINKSRQAIME